jgi:hypothetical protein
MVGAISSFSGAVRGPATTPSGLKAAFIPPQAETDTRRSTLMRLSLPAAAALALCLSGGAAMAQCASAQNQVQNCGFETGDFTDWTMSGSNAVLSQTWAYGVDALNAHTGTYEAYMGTEGATPGTHTSADSLTLSQSIALTENLTYQISFYIDQDTAVYKGYTNYFAAVWDGTTLMQETAAAVTNGYVYETFTVTGSASGANTLAFLSQNDAGYWSLDDVSLIEIPEPASLAAFGLGLVGLTAAYRRRRAARA